MPIPNFYKWLNKEKSRYYTIAIQKTPADEIVLNYTWGGCNSNRGGKKNILVRTEEEVGRYINLMKRRRSRGYELITPLMELLSNASGNNRSVCAHRRNCK